MLSLKNVSAGYVKGNMILKGIDLEVGDNEVVAIVGQNGSGKSTLAKSILNMVPYKEGDIVFNGENINKFQTHEISKLGIGFFMQGGRIFPNLTVEENLVFSARGLRKKEYLLRKDKIKGFFKLSGDNGKIQASYLSGGEQHMLALAMILMQQPRFLILDEPSAGLSPTNVKMIYEVLGRIKKEKVNSILIIEQNVASAIEFSDRITSLQGGKIAKNELSERLDSSEKIDGFYFGNFNLKE